MKQDIAHRTPCQNCGGSDFEWGCIHPYASNRETMYTADDKHSSWGLTGIDLRARRCTGCGHLELFAPPEPAKPAWDISNMPR